MLRQLPCRRHSIHPTARAALVQFQSMVLTKVVVVAGVSSGVGKTSLAVGIMAALRKRGLIVQPFKVGPDFLDPMHHEVATGRPSINLDGWMMNKETNLACFDWHTRDADVAVVEGVMGLFDGRDGVSETGSTAEMAKWLGAPVVLVLDCWALSRSAAAMVHGYSTFDAELNVAGVVFNKVGGAVHTRWLTDALGAAHVAARALGGVPKVTDVTAPERHLGLHMPAEAALANTRRVDRLAELVETHLDVDALMSVAGSAARDPASLAALAALRAPPPARRLARVAVVQDAAFCFYYHTNLRLLEANGVEVVAVSALGSCHETLPRDVDAVYLGGGYPELHASELHSGRVFRGWVHELLRVGGVVYAECGGLMYASQFIETKAAEGAEAERFSGLGLLPFGTRMSERMSMGYAEVSATEACPLFPPNQKCRGQRYHFSEIVPDPSGDSPLCTYTVLAQTPGAVPQDEGFFAAQGANGGWVLASYVHLHWASNPSFAASAAASFVEARVRRLRAGRGQGAAGSPSAAPSTGVCSLVPAATEMLVALGLGSRIIGCTEFCPAVLASAAPHVVSRSAVDASTLSPMQVEAALKSLRLDGRPAFVVDTEWLERERPSVIFVQSSCTECDVTQTDVARALASCGMLNNSPSQNGAPKLVDVSPNSMDSMLESLVRVADAMGAQDQAAVLVAELRARLQRVQDATGDIFSKPRVLSLEGLDPIAVGGGWLPDMKIKAGGIDGLFSPGCPAERPKWEDIIHYKPEVLLLTPCSFSTDRTLAHLHLLASKPGFWSMPAVQNQQVFILDGTCFTQPGPGLVAGVEAIGGILHPQNVPWGVPNDQVGMILKLEVSVKDLDDTWPCDAHDLKQYFVPYTGAKSQQ